MFRGFKSVLAGALVGLVCTAASAQIIAIPLITWKYAQPWTAPWHSHESVVRDCNGNQVPFSPIAMDDWICTATGPIVRLRWWGTSPQPLQIPNRQFLIRIYSNAAAACQPANLLYSACVLASNAQVGIDCRQRRVYRFNANLPTPFTQTAGTHYWLQISEVDGVAGAMQSPTLNAIDFEWSAHRNIKNCNARQRTPAGVFIVPLLDDCDMLEDDLSFVLYRSTIIVNVPPPVLNPTAILPRPVYIAEFRKQGDADTLSYSECFSPDDDGSSSLQPELAPGMYQVAIRGGSFRPSFFDVFVDIDGNYMYDLGNVAVGAGDVDGDGDTDFADITGVLVGWHP